MQSVGIDFIGITILRFWSHLVIICGDDRKPESESFQEESSKKSE